MQQKFMLLAHTLANKAYSINEVPVGAVVVKDNKIIGKGYNRTHTDNDPTAHAEVVAIKQATKLLKSNNLSDCEIYITLEPCMFCFGLINSVKIKKIYFDHESPENGVCGGWQELSLLKPFGNSVICQKINIDKEYPKLLNKFFKKRRNGRVV